MRRDQASAIDRAMIERKCLDMARKHLGIMGMSHLDLPPIRIVTRTGAGWAGLHTFTYNRATQTGRSDIQIQTYTVDGGDRSLERIVAHEMIHFVLYEQHGWAARHINHGPKFLALRAIVNAALGEDFVQVACGADFKNGALRKPIQLVMWKKAANPGPSFAWFARETPKVRRMLMRLGAHPNSETRVTVTREHAWTSYPKLATCRFAFPSEHLSDSAQQLWNGGVPIKVVDAKPSI